MNDRGMTRKCTYSSNEVMVSRDPDPVKNNGCPSSTPHAATCTSQWICFD